MLATSLPPFPKRYRIILIFTVSLLTVTYLVSKISSQVRVALPSSVRDHLPDHIPHAQLPELNKLNPFAGPRHKPAIQSNSSLGDTKWHADFRWASPFSRDVTQDEERSVLPPLRRRPPVYTYYEPDSKSSREIRAAEDKIIFQWRRAWWAQGFRPVVLGRADALQNPLYKKVQVLQVQDNIEKELARWLAWANMGGGVLADWLTFPMAGSDNPLLAFLSRGRYPKLTRYENLKGGLYCGNKMVVTKAIEQAIKKPDIKRALSLADGMFTDMFSVDTSHGAVALYDSDTITKKFKAIAEPLFNDKRARGLGLLGDLINAHLHATFQASFPEIAVLKPLPQYTTSLTDPALLIAQNLTLCPPNNPMDGSCPPNKAKCKRCIASQPVPITTPGSLRNSTEKFYIGTVPHPYTTISLINSREAISSSFVRRLGYKDRDLWVDAITKSALQHTNDNRLSVLKLAVASDWAQGRTLWVTAEDGIPVEELQWEFGFQIPHHGQDARKETKSSVPVPGAERQPKNKDDNDEGKQRPETQKLLAEQLLLDKAKEVIKTKGSRNQRIREAVEGWNMGDIEAWRFVRAFEARRIMARRQWEKDERRFAGAEKKGGKWGRWFDS